MLRVCREPAWNFECKGRLAEICIQLCRVKFNTKFNSSLFLRYWRQATCCVIVLVFFFLLTRSFHEVCFSVIIPLVLLPSIRLVRACTFFVFSSSTPYEYFNLLTPNVNYSDRTAPLTSKVTFYIFIQQI